MVLFGVGVDVARARAGSPAWVKVPENCLKRPSNGYADIRRKLTAIAHVIRSRTRAAPVCEDAISNYHDALLDE